MTLDARRRVLAIAPAYLFAVLLATVLKLHYSTADGSGLRWILAPTAWLVERITDMPFAFAAHAGYVSADGALVIAPACAGINFMIVCCCMLAASHLHRPRTAARKTALLAAIAAAAYALTVVVNAARIALSMHPLHAAAPVAAALSPAMLHRLLGIAIYFLALSALYLAAQALAERLAPTAMRDPTGRRHSPRPRLVVPLFWYVAITLGIPLLRVSYRGHMRDFALHACCVLLVPIGLVAALAAARRAATFHR